MASFAPVPDVPLEGLNLAESSLFKAMKENIEILAGSRVAGTRAITSDLITIQPTDTQGMKRITATGATLTFANGAAIAAYGSPIVILSASDYGNLMNDVQNVANDVARLQNVLNSLLGLLRS